MTVWLYVSFMWREPAEAAETAAFVCEDVSFPGSVRSHLMGTKRKNVSVFIEQHHCFIVLLMTDLVWAPWWWRGGGWGLSPTSLLLWSLFSHSYLVTVTGEDDVTSCLEPVGRCKKNYNNLVLGIQSIGFNCYIMTVWEYLWLYDVTTEPHGRNKKEDTTM